MRLVRSLLVPLCAAFAAALIAHIGIDVLGDYALPHDAYDDLAHESRAFVLGLVTILASSLGGAWLLSAVREARGSVDMLSREFRASLSLGRLPFFLTTLGCATILLVAMEALDVKLAGGAIDDLADLFGGSVFLGFGTLVASVFAAVFVARRGVRALANLRRTLVRALAIAFAGRGSYAPAERARPFSRTRILGRELFLTRLRKGRAPPFSLLARP